METVRTPEDRFIDLPDYPFEPHDAKIPDCEGDTLRVHYLDEGRSDGSTVLLIHGEPTWSYLYRDMIPPLVSAGHRVIVPDLVGFGRSDKPTETTDYSYARHVVWASSLIFDHLDLQDITFFGQDWGGLIGLRLVADQPDRYERVAIANTALPTGEGWTEAFVAWQKFSQDSPTFPIGKIVNGGCATDLPVEVIAAYDAPFQMTPTRPELGSSHRWCRSPPMTRKCPPTRRHGRSSSSLKSRSWSRSVTLIR